MWSVTVEYTSSPEMFDIQDRIERTLGFGSGASGFCFPTQTRDMIFYHEEEGDARKTRGIVRSILYKEKGIKWTTELKREE